MIKVVIVMTTSLFIVYNKTPHVEMNKDKKLVCTHLQFFVESYETTNMISNGKRNQLNSDVLSGALKK